MTFRVYTANSLAFNEYRYSDWEAGKTLSKAERPIADSRPRRGGRTADVTVAIPTYQRDHFLKDALDSVVSQTLTDLEIIVSDNANSPTTRRLVESYGDPRIAYAPLQENIGLHGNLTRCLHLGSAPYVSMLLDDDTMYPANLEKKVSLLEQHPTAGVAHGALDYVDEEGKLYVENVRWAGPSAFETGNEFIELSMDAGTRVCVSSAVMRRTAVAQLCLDDRDGSDFGLWLRIASSWDFAFVDEPLSTFRVHPGADSSRLGLYEIAEDRVMTTPGLVRAERAAKLRFLDEYNAPRRERRALRRTARSYARTKLKHIVAEDDASCEKSAPHGPSLSARLRGSSRACGGRLIPPCCLRRASSDEASSMRSSHGEPGVDP